MKLTPNKTPVELIKEGLFGGIYFRTFIMMLMENGIESHAKNLMSWEISIKSIIVHIFMILLLINRFEMWINKNW